MRCRKHEKSLIQIINKLRFVTEEVYTSLFEMFENIIVRYVLQFPFSSLLTGLLSLLYNTLMAMRFPAKITSSCIWVAIPVD